MTRSRLRSTVTYLPTRTGILFRNGDAFLPVSGTRIWSSFQSIEPFLKGTPVSEEVHREWSEHAPGQLGNLYRALKFAGMLYEPSDQDNIHLSSAALERFGPEAAVELKSDSAFAAFASLRRKRFAIVGRSDLALAIATAALESGLCNLALYCPDWASSHDDALQRIVRDHAIDSDKVPGSSATGAKWVPPFSPIPECDGYMLAAELESGGDFLISSFQMLLDSHAQPGLAMLIGKKRLIASVCDPYAACTLCIAASLMQEPQSSSAVFLEDARREAQEGRKVEVGARLLLRHLWDTHLDGPLSIAQYTMIELNLSTYAITRRARPYRSACLAHPAAALKPLPPPEQSRHHLMEPISKLEFCKRAEALCVDSENGLIRVLEEGDLLQFPRHQCAARLSDDDAAPDSPWLIECGLDMVEARSRAVRTALERHYDRYFRRTHAHALEGPYCNAAGNPAQLHSELLFDEGVTVSGETWDEVLEQGFFRTLARHSLTLDSWIPIQVMLDIPSDPEVQLIAEYLKDVDAFDSIVVYEHLPSLNECPILRFDHHGRTISVVAGIDRVLAWRIGLEDIWMSLAWMNLGSIDLAEVDVLEPRGETHRTPIQLRAALGPASIEDRANTSARLEDCLGIKLCIFPVPVEDSMKLLSLSFAYACLTRARHGQTAHISEERDATLTCSEER